MLHSYLWLALYPLVALLGFGGGFYLGGKEEKWAADQLDLVWLAIQHLPDELKAEVHKELAKLGM